MTPGKVLNQSWQQVEAGGDLIYYQPHVSKVHPAARGLLEAAVHPLLTAPHHHHMLPSSLSRAAAKLGFSRERQCGDEGLSQRKADPSFFGAGGGGAETISQIFLGDAFESVSVDKPFCILSVHARCGKASLSFRPHSPSSSFSPCWNGRPLSAPLPCCTLESQYVGWWSLS